MDAPLFVKGLLLGLSIAAPVGPIGVLCIRRTMAFGFAAGLAGGLGTALADAFYAALAAFGFASLLGDWIAANDWFRLIGAAMLLYLAVQAWRSTPAAEAKVGATSLAGTFAATFALTLANPTTILTFLAIFTAFGIEGAAPADIALLIAAVFLGSLGWWIALAGAVANLRTRIDARATQAINRGSAALLALFAVLIAGKFI